MNVFHIYFYNKYTISDFFLSALRIFFSDGKRLDSMNLHSECKDFRPDIKK